MNIEYINTVLNYKCIVLIVLFLFLKMLKKESVSELVSITENKILGTGQETESMK